MPHPYKQLSLDTSMRNPERFKDILTIIKEYDGQTLDDETITNIVCKLMLESRNNPFLPSSDHLQLTDEDTIDSIRDRVINIHSGRKAIGGFPGESTGRGHIARFHNYTWIPREFGLIYAEYNGILEFSEVGNMFINNELTEQQVFAMQAIKHNRRNPYRASSKIGNDFNYFRFLLKVLLQKETNRLSYNQFVLSTFSIDGDVDDFLETIEENTIPDSDTLKSLLLDIQNDIGSHFKILSETTYYKDYPDSILRMLTICGFITNNQYVYSLNDNQKEMIEKLAEIDFVLIEEEKTDKKLYFEKLGTYSREFKDIFDVKVPEPDIIDVNTQLHNLVREFNVDEDQLIEAIKYISNGGKFNKYFPIETLKRKNPVSLKRTPLLFELLISLLLYIKYGDQFYIKPSYKTDSKGIPLHYASRQGDIYVYSNNSKEIYWLVEVTLITSKKQQLNNETTSIVRHLLDDNEFSEFKEKHLNLIAPYIHEDTNRFLNFITFEHRTDSVFVKALETVDFLNLVKNYNNIDDNKTYKEKYLDNI
ncbi:hypothetical protein N9V10_03955 [Candidatus Marinimicrobia bacterium]|nr:hypothetical protein [Candidatus Neomarinimicrobiota bacterium]